jgi:uncharacterized protein
MSNELKDITKIIGKYQLLIFLILTVIISLIAMELILSGINILFPRFPETSDMYLILNGLIQYNNLGSMVILILIYFLCPAIVAMIMLLILEGRKSATETLKGLLKWKTGLQWYILAIALPIVIELLTAIFYVLSGNAISKDYVFSLLPWNIQVPQAMSPSEIASLTSSSLIPVAPWNITIPVLGEIPGAILIPLFMIIWSLSLAIGLYGYALPRMLKQFNPLISAATLGVFTVFISVPLLINNPNILIMIAGEFALAFVAVWLYSMTNNNILVVAIFLLFMEYMPNVITYFITSTSGNSQAVYINKLIIVVIALAIVILQRDYFLKKIRAVATGNKKSTKK